MVGNSISNYGKGGMKTKIMAAKTALSAGCHLAITNGNQLIKQLLLLLLLLLLATRGCGVVHASNYMLQYMLLYTAYIVLGRKHFGPTVRADISFRGDVAKDIAGAALYLAAETGSWITGQALVLDGGGQIKF